MMTTGEAIALRKRVFAADNREGAAHEGAMRERRAPKPKRAGRKRRSARQPATARVRQPTAPLSDAPMAQAVPAAQAAEDILELTVLAPPPEESVSLGALIVWRPTPAQPPQAERAEDAIIVLRDWDAPKRLPAPEPAEDEPADVQPFDISDVFPIETTDEEEAAAEIVIEAARAELDVAALIDVTPFPIAEPAEAKTPRRLLKPIIGVLIRVLQAFVRPVLVLLLLALLVPVAAVGGLGLTVFAALF